MADGKLVLIDGHALAFRAFYALPVDMATSRGELTNAVFGFFSMLLNVMRDQKPDYLIVAFDTGRTFRHEEYAEYKAHRARMPQELTDQMARIRQIVEAMNIPILEAEGFEADDVLGTLALQASLAGLSTCIVTGDSDLLQLVEPQVQVMLTGHRLSDARTYDQQAVRERYGLEPRQLIDLKALIGDASDNIPGVRGVGEKTATPLLQQYGSVEEVYAHLEAITAKRARTALQEGQQSALLSKRLVTIRTDAPVNLDTAAARRGDFDHQAVIALFQELEFRSLISRLPGAAPAAPPGQLSLFDEPVVETAPAAGDCHIVDTPPKLEALIQALTAAEAIAFDTETTGTDPLRVELVGLALAVSPEAGYYLPLGHRTPEKQLAWEEVREQLKPILENPATPKYAHNASYDVQVLAQHGLEVQNVAFDTMLAEWVLDPAGHSLGLKEMALNRLGLEMTPITALIGSGKTQKSMALVPVSQAGPYAAADAYATYGLVAPLQAELHQRQLWALFRDVEMPLLPVLIAMERAGVKLDVGYLQQMSAQLGRRLDELAEAIYGQVGYSFNIGSTQQLSDALFVRLGLPTQGIRKNKSGHYSTAADVLERLRGQHAVMDLLLEQRELAKLQSTYVDALPQLVNPDTGRLHTSFRQTGTVTGRISSSNPNLQNIPIRTEQGRQVRRAFVAQEGWLLLAADYSQVELRVLAHISQDPGLLAAFRQGEDIHRTTAAAVYGVPASEVTYDMRRVAKTANFAMVYGSSAYGLAQQTGLSPEDAARFMETYFARFPGVPAFIERTKKQAARQGYVETLLKRRRYFPELAHGSRAGAGQQRAAERMAINAPIQGSAADIIKIAMIRLHHALRERNLRSRMILQVHDELVLEVPRQELDDVHPLMVHIMEHAFDLDAPLKVDAEVGANWLEMKDV
ncbi:MAG: DNA polymerase I [Chloroflexota bacterium]